jgi:hypothetical protein
MVLCQTCKHCTSHWRVTADWVGDWDIPCAIGGTFWVEAAPEFIDIACSKYEKGENDAGR